MALLDGAETLCGYNAVLFDLEFIRRGFVSDISDERMTAWVLKCVDPYMCARYISGTTCKMQHMLDLNGLSAKTASGTEAITMALEGRWPELLDYCLEDAQLTLALCQLDWINFTPFLQAKISASAPPQFRFAMPDTAPMAAVVAVDDAVDVAVFKHRFVFCDDDGDGEDAESET